MGNVGQRVTWDDSEGNPGQDLGIVGQRVTEYDSGGNVWRCGVKIYTVLRIAEILERR